MIKGTAFDKSEFVQAIRQSGFFDDQYYMDHFNVNWNGRDPVAHFLENWREHMVSPSRKFDICKYLAVNPDVYSTGLNPLAHFLKKGREEGKRAWHVDEDLDKETIFPALKNVGSDLQRVKFKHRRAAIFASYDANYVIHDSLIHYLEELAGICDSIIFVSDNYYPIQELLKIRHMISYYECKRHATYDFGSYKRGIEVADQANILSKIDELVICNDSVFGPAISLQGIFVSMNGIQCDFWGMTNNAYYVPEHIQSYFMVFRKPVLKSGKLVKYFNNINPQNDASSVIKNCEIPLTSYLEDQGFVKSQYMDVRNHPKGTESHVNNYNLTLDPAYCINANYPFVKKRPLATPFILNRSGNIVTRDALRNRYIFLYNMIVHESDAFNSVRDGNPAFSLIMPSWNRADIICASIDSVLAQTYHEFELIIVDDCSTDNTEDVIYSRYAAELDTNKIVYKRLVKNCGVCKARNAGLQAARNEWIGYVDSDNLIKCMFLEYFATAISENPDTKCFYSRFIRSDKEAACGRPFDYQKLLQGNYIDLGVFVHHRDLINELGGFDEKMTRLVDYELILRYTGKYAPFYIPCPLMVYNNGDHERISNSASFGVNQCYVNKKHGSKERIAVIITCFEQDGPLATAVESAICQSGDYGRDIYIHMPYASEQLQSVGERFAEKYPTQVTMSLAHATFAEAVFYASQHADFVAFLAADDAWTLSGRLLRAIGALQREPGADLLMNEATVVTGVGMAHRLSSRRPEPRFSFQKGWPLDWINPADALSTMVIRSERLASLPQADITSTGQAALSIARCAREGIWQSENVVLIHHKEAKLSCEENIGEGGGAWCEETDDIHVALR